MALRKIVKFDEEKCNGCGLCVPACAEGAIKIIDGKARLVSDKYCDGLGACLGECPQGAITIIEREADEFDEEAVKQHLNHNLHVFSCPGSRMMDLRQEKTVSGHSCPGAQPMDLPEDKSTGVDATGADSVDINISIKSQLRQWPVQLMLVPVEAPYFEGANLLITADCAAVAYPNYHLGLLKGKTAVMGCPKLDDGNYYVEKLTDIIKSNDIKSITVAHMEVPCCYGMVQIAQEALARSGKNIPFKTVEISIEGNII
ncbi:MAG: hypothetical protein PWQ60_1545 [Thermoanaerobacteraceae bacterium]|nr:hypothetical protein [Thermoanaerobacteraceae bacterium]